MNKKTFETLLYKSFDSTLSAKESADLKAALENSPEFRDKYLDAIVIRKAVTGSAEPEFRYAFEERVLAKISGQSSPQGFWDVLFVSLPKSFRRVAYAGLITLGALVFYNVSEGNSIVINSVFGKSVTTIEAAFDPTTQIFWNTTR